MAGLASEGALTSAGPTAPSIWRFRPGWDRSGCPDCFHRNELNRPFECFPQNSNKYVPVEVRNERPIQPQQEIRGYYLRYPGDGPEGGKRRLESVGKDISVAFVAFLNRKTLHMQAEMGLAPATQKPSVKNHNGNGNGSRLRMADGLNKTLQEIEEDVRKGKKSVNTLRAYKRATIDFRDHCGVTYFDEITREVLLAHETWLYKNLRKRVRGKKSNTVAARFRCLTAFLNRHGIQLGKRMNAKPDDPGLMRRDEVPQEEKKRVDKYSEEEIRNMLAVATEDQADLIHTFLRTGMRDEEVVYLEWDDVDFEHKQILIREKPGVWKPKDKEEREIPCEDGILLKRLAARRKRQKPANKLVFPNTLGCPDMHLIRQLHKIVDKMKKRKQTLKGDPTLHRFRRTYASMMIPHTDLQTVSELLGHSRLDTTSRYLAPDQQKARIGTRNAFKKVNG